MPDIKGSVIGGDEGKIRILQPKSKRLDTDIVEVRVVDEVGERLGCSD
jgi:hypothetical protein